MTKKNQKPSKRRRYIPTIPTRYCPRCEKPLVLKPPTVYNIYNCTTCETLLFESETDERPGQTKLQGSKVILVIHSQTS